MSGNNLSLLHLFVVTGSPDFSQRLQLSQRLSSLPGPQLDQVIFALKPAAGNIPPASAPPGDRVMALLTWAESEIGCGLETLQQVLNSVLARPEDAVTPTSQGKRVFISYRSQEPDVSLAQVFHDQLQAAGHEPFMAAESIDWGENWVNRIDQELKCCDYFLLLLSERSATSDMVAGEVRTARRLRDQLGKPVILPVRVNLPLDDPLNYELRSVLQTIQQKSWQGPEDTAALVQDFLALIEAGDAPAPVKEKDEPEITPPSHQRPPLPVADLELPSGTMPLDSKFYIRREPWDTRCLQEIENRGGLVRIKAPRQMGKTSLLARIRDRATELGYQPEFLTSPDSGL